MSIKKKSQAAGKSPKEYKHRIAEIIDGGLLKVME